MKKLIIAAILFLAVLPLSAAEPIRVHGKVTEDKNGVPIPGAVIKLDDNYLWAVTDINGVFTFDKVEPGSYQIEVSCLGYVTVTQPLSVVKPIPSGGLDYTNLNIVLNVNSLALNEVVVTASTSKDNINTTQSIGRNALDHLQLSNMSNISALLPGIMDP